ncbi:fimbrial protein [Enterobacter bugandensis]|uniref:fimbrial protein n=1 Tax=Enterobacter bugandensis TaxID=881260 RepID=UPI0022E5477B|nr:fimbrial protein [Enterobacter bugandensis]
MKNTEWTAWSKMLQSALLSSILSSGAVCGTAMIISTVADAASLNNVDGEHGTLTVSGQLVDSPCRMSMESRDQSVDLGTLSSADMAHTGARSRPVSFSVRLEGCLVASGHLFDEQTDSTVWSSNQPTVYVAFTAPADLNDPSLMRLNGVEGVALRITDDHNRDIRLGSRGLPQLLTPGDNTLTWTVVAERVLGKMVPGMFRAIANFTLSYD